MSNIIAFVLCFLLLPLLLLGLLGLLLGWLFFRGKKQVGDLSVEGEGALRAEADSLRARVQELEARISKRDGEVSDLRGQLAGSATAAPADDDETYALEWRNRYLAARVKYLEGRLSDTPKPKKKAPAKKKAAPKKKVAKKKVAKKKPAPKKAAKPKVLYTDGPTDGKPDDLKLIKGIGPKFEKDLNKKGIYYFRQIAAWQAKDVKMVEGVIDSFPGRIGRDEWIKQAKGLAKGGKPRAMASVKKAKPKKAAVKKKTAPKKKAAPKAKLSAADAAFEKYYTNVKKYDKSAKRSVVKNIVKYCGIALRSRDGQLVACSDEVELQRVADGFVTKKLGKKTGQMDLVKGICQDMKGERFKQRVTFYYLAAKKARKLNIFS